MARKKRDFWDDVDEDEFLGEKTETPKKKKAKSAPEAEETAVKKNKKAAKSKVKEQSTDEYVHQLSAMDNQELFEEDEYDDDDDSVMKSTPFKVFFRALLLVSCMVAMIAGYVVYDYVQVRYNGGAYSADFYDSKNFTDTFNDSVDKMLELVQAIEADSSVTAIGNEELLNTLVENYMGKDTNFAFLIQDSDNFTIVSSGDDAKDRIEASNHYVMISTKDGSFDAESSLSGTALNKTAWQESLEADTNAYIIYGAVDNSLVQVDSYYKAQQAFDATATDYGRAKVVGIAALVVFIITLIICVMTTGRKRGYKGVYLSAYDRLFTELSLVIMAGAAFGIYYLVNRFVFPMTEGKQYERVVQIAFVVVEYIWIIRSYFSIVRRIKAGRFVSNSLIYIVIAGICTGIGKLPKALAVIVSVILLAAINGGMVYAMIFVHSPTVKGVPVSVIAAPIVFIIEIIALIHWMTHHNDEDAETAEVIEEKAEKPAKAMQTPEKPVQSPADDDSDMKVVPAKRPSASSIMPEESAEWEAIDLGKSIEALSADSEEEQKYPSSVNETPIIKGTVPEFSVSAHDKTSVIPTEEITKALKAAGFTPETVVDDAAVATDAADAAVRTAARRTASAATGTAGIAAASAAAAAGTAAQAAPVQKNLTQLNKDIRKKQKAALKARDLSVAVRAPESAVCVKMDAVKMKAVVEGIFEQITVLAAVGSRTVIELFAKEGKVIYITKIQLDDEAKAAAAKETATAAGTFAAVSRNVEENGGRFVSTVEDGILKIGIMMDAE